MGSEVQFPVTQGDGHVSLLGGRGIVPFTTNMGPHIMLYRRYTALIPPFHVFGSYPVWSPFCRHQSMAWVVHLNWLPAWIHLPPTLSLSLCAQTGTVLPISLWATCAYCYAWWVSPFWSHGLCMNVLCDHSQWALLWPHTSMALIFPMDHCCGPYRKDRILMSIIVLIILILMGLQGFILWIIIFYVYMWQKVPHFSTEQDYG